MTDPQIQREDDGPHEGPIRTPKQLILAVAYAFVLPILVIVLLVVYVTSSHRPAAGSDALGADQVAKRIAPVGMVQVKDASDLSTLKSGQQVFATQCATCHAAGLLGSPKFGDAGAWAPRIKTGYPALLNSALHGKGQMPAQGGGDFTDFEIGRAVVYMANKGGASFDEPPAPAAAVASAEADATPTAAAANPATASSVTVASVAPATAPATAATVSATTPTATAVATASPATPSPAAKAEAGAVPALYAQVCQACHASGLAGAPKFGDKAAWGPRLAQGIDGLTASAIHGKGAMPPRGGSAASDADIKAVVTYFVSAAK